MSKKIETSAITAGRPAVTPDAPLNPSIVIVPSLSTEVVVPVPPLICKVSPELISFCVLSSAATLNLYC
ncbi:MAG: hypothetical protein EBX11_00570 [Actinobacteria bacterium]|nr:hypothetical protein [Actinomycetota bacterium]